jgi:uncharacterized protein
VPRQPAPTLDRPWHRRGRLGYTLGRLRGFARPPMTVTEPPDELVIDRDVEVHTRDGTVLRVNVFRAADEGPRPVIVSAHPYGKDNVPARRGKRWTYSPQYRMLRQPAPVTFSALTGWEAPDPVWWVEQGFAVVNADLRGCGHSDGVGKLLSQDKIFAQSVCNNAVSYGARTAASRSQVSSSTSWPARARAKAATN